MKDHVKLRAPAEKFWRRGGKMQIFFVVLFYFLSTLYFDHLKNLFFYVFRDSKLVRVINLHVVYVYGWSH